MTANKLSNLTEITNPSLDDLLHIVHDPAGVRVDRKIKVRNLIGSVTYNVRWYGAVGDGIADDTAAIQAAIDAATSSQVYGFTRPGRIRIYLPSGVYKITDAIDLCDKQGLTLEGDSYTVIDAHCTDKAAISTQMAAL